MWPFSPLATAVDNPRNQPNARVTNLVAALVGCAEVLQQRLPPGSAGAAKRRTDAGHVLRPQEAISIGRWEGLAEDRCQNIGWQVRHLLQLERGDQLRDL